MNIKNIDNWLLHNCDYTQEERETIMRFFSEYSSEKDGPDKKNVDKF